MNKRIATITLRSHLRQARERQHSLQSGEHEEAAPQPQSPDARQPCFDGPVCLDDRLLQFIDEKFDLDSAALGDLAEL